MAMASSKSIRSVLRFSSARYAPAVTKEQKQAIHATVKLVMLTGVIFNVFLKMSLKDTLTKLNLT